MVWFKRLYSCTLAVLGTHCSFELFFIFECFIIYFIVWSLVGKWLYFPYWFMTSVHSFLMGLWSKRSPTRQCGSQFYSLLCRAVKLLLIKDSLNVKNIIHLFPFELSLCFIWSQPGTNYACWCMVWLLARFKTFLGVHFFSNIHSI